MIDWRPECTKQSWGTSAGEFTGGPTKILLHSTETGTWPGYNEGQSAPHETWRWNHSTKKFDKRQHVPHTLASRSLKNADGGVQTNRDGVHQVELIGSCDKTFATKYGYDYIPEMGDDFLRELGLEIRKLAKDVSCSIILTKRPWVRYPDSYGLSASQRMGQVEWDGFAGICGHEHAPENDHGDPGNLNVARAMELSQENDMPLDNNDVSKVWTTDGIVAAPSPDPNNAFWAPASYLKNIYNQAEGAKKAVAELTVKVDALTAKIDALPSSTTDAVAIAEELAKRLQA